MFPAQIKHKILKYPRTSIVIIVENTLWKQNTASDALYCGFHYVNIIIKPENDKV